MLDSIICSPLPSCTSSVCPAAFKSRAFQAHLFSANIQVQQPPVFLAGLKKRFITKGACSFILGYASEMLKKYGPKYVQELSPYSSLRPLYSSCCPPPVIADNSKEENTRCALIEHPQNHAWKITPCTKSPAFIKIKTQSSPHHWRHQHRRHHCHHAHHHSHPHYHLVFVIDHDHGSSQFR